MAPGAERTYFGAVVRRDFKAGEPLVPGGVVMPGARGFLAAVLAPGMRAVALGVDAASSAAGLVQPGDYVDVMLAQSRTNAPESRSVVGETVLQNVRVIAVDQTFSSGGEPGSVGKPVATIDNRIPKTVTLEVGEDAAKRLLVAAQLGKLTLAIRALAGAYASPVRQTEDTLPVWSGDVSAASGRSNSVSRGGPSATGKTQVRIIRGSNAGGQ
jgi:pilus assembly protein CpaB